MARYKLVLMERVLQEEAETKEQEDLKKQFGFENEDVIIHHKKWNDYILSSAKRIGYVIYVILVFLGLITVLNPVSRDLILKLFDMVS